MTDAFKPPQPVGEPFRADPSDPVPFPDEQDSPRQLPPTAADEQAAHPPSHTPEYAVPSIPNDGRVRPQFRAQPQVQKRKAREHERMAKIALAVGIASIVISPILGPVAIVMGSMAVKRGEKSIGWWAISTGIAGTVIGIVVAILVATGVIPSFSELLNDIQNGQK